jgi:hypothetical protein
MPAADFTSPCKLSPLAFTGANDTWNVPAWAKDRVAETAAQNKATIRLDSQTKGGRLDSLGERAAYGAQRRLRVWADWRPGPGRSAASGPAAACRRSLCCAGLVWQAGHSPRMCLRYWAAARWGHWSRAHKPPVLLPQACTRCGCSLTSLWAPSPASWWAASPAFLLPHSCACAGRCAQHATHPNLPDSLPLAPAPRAGLRPHVRPPCPQLTDDLTGARDMPTEFNVNFYSGAPTFQPSSMDFGTFSRGGFVGGASDWTRRHGLAGLPRALLRPQGSPSGPLAARVAASAQLARLSPPRASLRPAGKQFKQADLQAAAGDELFSTHVLPHYYTINWQKTFIRVYVDGGLLAEFNSSTSSNWASPSNPALMRLSLWSVAGMYSGPLAAGQVATSSFYDVRRVVCVKNSVANAVKSSKVGGMGRLRAGGGRRRSQLLLCCAWRPGDGPRRHPGARSGSCT